VTTPASELTLHPARGEAALATAYKGLRGTLRCSAVAVVVSPELQCAPEAAHDSIEETGAAETPIEASGCVQWPVGIAS